LNSGEKESTFSMAIENIIYNTAVADGMPATLATFIVAQAKHETGNFQHRFFTQGNNAFGYSWVSGNDKWQLPDPGPVADNGVRIAQYATVQNSVHELTDWIKRRQAQGKFPRNLKEITTPESYAWYLKNSGYYGASYTLYSDRLRYWYDRLPPLVKGGGLLLIGAALVLFFHKQLGL
jgi:uncharacterized FlgJ-related protein